MSKFSFRRKDKMTFKHIAHGLIPAATIAPRPAVPRTPPPRSPYPSPERPRSALAAAILSSSLTGRTVAIPLVRQRSLSDSDCSRSATRTAAQPLASTAEYTRDRWIGSLTDRPRLPSPEHSDTYEDDEEDDGEEESIRRTALSEPDESHIYQSLERRGRSLARNDLYSVPVKQMYQHSETNDVTNQSEDTAADTGEEIAAQEHTFKKDSSPARTHVDGIMQSPDEQEEIHLLRRQAQELVDENDALKMTVHRLNVELSRYQAQFRPLSKEESSKVNALPKKGPAPPWLVDMKYLSPLLLAYEDQLNEKDSLLQSYAEEMHKFRERVEEVIQENKRLHKELAKAGGISQKEWRQLQDQARLVLKENQVLVEQLEVQQAKAKESHSRHQQEVTKVSKEVMLLEAERQSLREELEEVRAQLQSLQGQHQRALSSLESTVGQEEHSAMIGRLHRHLEQQEEEKRREVEELAGRVASLQAEIKGMLLEKSNLTAELKRVECDLKASCQANRKAQRKIGLLKVQVEDSLEQELTTHQYMANIVSLAEKTTLERDQLMHMASVLEHDKQGVLTKIVEGTVCLGNLHEKVKVYKRKAAARLSVMGHQLQQQEEDFAGRAASYQREIRHLQRLLRDKQEALDEVLQQKREMEGELETVWEATTKEKQRIKEALFQSLTWAEWSPNPTETLTALGFTEGSRKWEELPHLTPIRSSVPSTFISCERKATRGFHRSPMFESDSEQPQNQSSDEGE